MTEEYRVARVDELSDGERIIVEVKGREITVFQIDDEYRAYLNWCPHQGGPVCEGGLTGRMDAEFDRETLETDFEWLSEDSTLVCPWHDWEFDVRTGDCRSGDVDLLTYPVTVDDGALVLSV